jgi:iron complex transport system substrate-binding protein
MILTRRTLFAALTCALSLPLAAQAADITHDLGTTTVPDVPQRIVVLEFSFVDALAAVGVVPVGIADDNHPDRLMPVYGGVIGEDWVSVGSRYETNLELIASLQPDLIIADSSRHAEIYDTLSQIAPTIELNSLGGDYHDMISAAAVIGEAIGRGKEMQARIAEHQALMEDYAGRIRPLAAGRSAQFGVANADALYLPAPTSYNGSLLEMLGFSSNMTAPEGGVYETIYIQTTLEQLSEVNPDILIVGEYSDPSAVDGWVGEPLFEALNAVEAGELHNVNANSWSRLRGMVSAEMSAADVLAIVGADGSDG